MIYSIVLFALIVVAVCVNAIRKRKIKETIFTNGHGKITVRTDFLILFAGSALVSTAASILFYAISKKFTATLLFALAVTLFLCFLSLCARSISYDEKVMSLYYFGYRYRQVKYTEVTDITNGMYVSFHTEDGKVTFFGGLFDIDPVLEQIYPRLNKKAVVHNSSKVRKLKNAVHDVSSLHGIIGLVSVLTALCVAIAVYLLIDDSGGFKASILLFILAIFSLLTIPITIISVKRAHASHFWDTIARLMVQEWMLVPEIKDVEELKYHLLKERKVLFTYENNQYVIYPCEEDGTLKFSLIDSENNEILKTNIEELMEFKFVPNVCINRNLSDMKFIHVYKYVYHRYK